MTTRKTKTTIRAEIERRIGHIEDRYADETGAKVDAGNGTRQLPLGNMAAAVAYGEREALLNLLNWMGQ